MTTPPWGHKPPPAADCTPEWEPDAVSRSGYVFTWSCACGGAPLAPFIGEDNARADFVRHVMTRRAAR